MESLKTSLRRAIDCNRAEFNLAAAADSDDVLFEKEFRRVNLGGDAANFAESSEAVIGKFYSELPADTDELGQKLREEARAQFLQRRSKQLLDNDELKALYALLESNAGTQPTP